MKTRLLASCPVPVSFLAAFVFTVIAHAQLPNAWQITDNSTTGKLNYATNLPTALQVAATNAGFDLTVNARFVNDFAGAKTMAMAYGLGGKRFLIWFYLNGGELTAELEGTSTNALTSGGTGTTLYHTHEIIYNPATGKASYVLDGQVLTTNWSPSASTMTTGQIYWGSGVTGGKGQMNFNRVTFEITNTVVAQYVAGTQGAPAIAPDPVTLGWTLSQGTGTTATNVSPDLVPLPTIPVAITLGTTNVGPYQATLIGSVNPGGFGVSTWFEYGTTTNYGNTTPLQDFLSDFHTINLSQTINGLAKGTTYHFRCVATNILGVAHSPDGQFTTPLVFSVGTLADSGTGSLRQAIADASPGDTITFATNGLITLTDGELLVTNDLTITGSGLVGGLAISGNTKSRVFQIGPTASVILDSLILMSGSVSNDSGGAILNSGNLTAINCLFTNNLARGGDGRSTGTAGGGGGGGAGMGGAIFSTGSGLTLSNCFFADNRVIGGQGGFGEGNVGGGTGGSGGGPNAGPGGVAGSPGGNGGYGGGGGGGGTFSAGGNGGFGAGGGGGGASPGGGNGGVAGIGGSFGGNGGAAYYSYSGGGGGGAGLGGAVFAQTGAVRIASCTFGGNLANNGTGGVGSFDYGNGRPGQGVGGAVFSASTNLILSDNVYSGNMASSFAQDVWPLVAIVVHTSADNGPGSLRDIVAEAPSETTITFDLSLSGQTFTLTSGQISVPKSLTVDASALGGGLTISGNTKSRLFQIGPTASVTLDSLILMSGSVSNDSGGAILNSGNLTAINCLFTNNTARGGDGQSTGNNGGGGGAGAGMGGAIFSSGMVLTLSNCVFANNHVIGGHGGYGEGNSGGNDPGGNGGGPNAGLGGSAGNSGGNGGYGGGGGGSGEYTGGYAGGSGGFGGGGGGGGAHGAGGSGGVGGSGGTFGGSGGAASSSFSGGGGGGAGLGGAVFAQSGTVAIASCTFSGNLANNGTGGLGSFGNGSGRAGQGVGGAVFAASTNLILSDNIYSGNMASSFAPDVGELPLIVYTSADAGPGSLRDVVAGAPGGTTITFGPSISGQVITLTSGQIIVPKSLTIDASALAGKVIINAGGHSRVLEITNASVTLDSLTLNNGKASGSSALAKSGGGILVDSNAMLTINNSTLSSNSAANFGGGIYNYGALSINNSTLSGNSAGTGGGGGIYNNYGTLALNSSTLSGNSAPGGFGGGIYTYSGTNTIINCTLSGNSAGTGGGIYQNISAGMSVFTNTIVAGNTATNTPNIFGSFDSISVVNTLTSGNPQLATLGDYGGPTQTMPPLAGSPAIDGGDDSVTNFLATDQRGYARLSGAHVDIGAVEYQFVSTNNPPVLMNSIWSSVGGTSMFQFKFSNVPGASFSVLTSTNLALPLANWTVLGGVIEIAPGQYQFTDLGATNYPQRFYRVVSP